jgi:DNA-binding XRE family transcriptional regulator
MKSSLMERFARLGPVRDVSRNESGFPAVIALSLSPKHPAPKTIDATMALAKRGLSMLKAKRAIEEIIRTGSVTVSLPTVENMVALGADLEAAGFPMRNLSVTLDEPVNVTALRKRLDLTREQFAERYGLDPETVRGWEIGRRQLDKATQSYLRVISHNPKLVEQIYASEPDDVGG